MLKCNLVLLSAFLLSACATSTTVPDPGPSGRLSQFAYSTEQISANANTPLGDEDWVARMGIARVPVFDSGTRLAEVLEVLREWGLKPLVGPETVIVKEGPSRHNFAAGEPEYVIYAFRDGALNFGPLHKTT